MLALVTKIQASKVERFDAVQHELQVCLVKPGLHMCASVCFVTWLWPIVRIENFKWKWSQCHKVTFTSSNILINIDGRYILESPDLYWDAWPVEWTQG